MSPLQATEALIFSNKNKFYKSPKNSIENQKQIYDINFCKSKFSEWLTINIPLMHQADEIPFDLPSAIQKKNLSF